MRKRKMLLWILYIFIALILAIILFVNFAPTFGGSPKDGNFERIKNSSNFDGKKFINLVDTKVMTTEDAPDYNLINGLKGMLFPPADKNPTKPLPSKKFVSDDLKDGKFVWFGHSTILMNLDEKIIMTDPLFHEASPVFFAGKPFEYDNKNLISDLPKIDVVVISHDHYDHLDYRAIEELNSKVEIFLVPLGIKVHLEKWGVASDKIFEFDWYEDKLISGINFTFTPTRHFSGRGLTNSGSTLWGSWVIKSDNKNVFFSGDSGYFDEFKKIGDKFGPFDICFVENGAYNKAWNQIHMFPEQGVQTCLDLGAKVGFPIHWSKFDLAEHRWNEPIDRYVKAAKENNLNYTVPLVGEVFDLDNLKTSEWWKDLE